MTLGRDLTVALMFLTRLPIRSSRPWKDDDLASSIIMFPVVGALLGLTGAGTFALSAALGFPSFLAASVTLCVLILLTGALHEDGLADMADGFGGGRTRDDKLRIMRDSKLGSYGALALILGLMLRVGALTSLANPWNVAAALIAASTLSRAAMPIAMTIMDQARKEGLAANAGRPHPGRAGLGLIIAILIAKLGLPWLHVVIVVVIACLGSALVLILARRQIGGITGDVLGALQQIIEIMGLLTLVSLVQSA